MQIFGERAHKQKEEQMQSPCIGGMFGEHQRGRCGWNKESDGG